MNNTLTILKALADKNRLIIVTALMKHEELCACQLIELLKVSGATSSRHLSILTNANIIQNRKDGRWVYYKLSDGIPDCLRSWLISSSLESSEFEIYSAKLNEILSLEPEVICKKQRQ